MEFLLNYRNYDIYTNYKIHKSITKEFFKNMSEYILTKHFGDLNIPFVIYKNNFPYIHNYKKHLIFWINPKYNELYDLDKVTRICKNLYGNFNHKIFRNPKKDQSVEDIFHYQCFILD